MTAADDIDKIIATINPGEYHGETPKEKKKLIKLKEGEGFEKAMQEAKPQPLSDFTIVYDSSTETLEPVYYWILDFMNDSIGDVDKLTDNFTSSPAGGHFSEQMGKATRMQEKATKILGRCNEVVKSVLNLIYDLKDFEMRLEHYEDAKSKDDNKAEGGTLALKQIWIDNVDSQKGGGSINMMAQQLQFVTLRDAFMSAKSPKEIENMDLNDRIKRILKARVSDFFKWKERSEKELKKRFQVEKRYLKSQVDALKLYTKWARPYLNAANRLEQSEELGKKPDSVNAFNTTIFELTLFGKEEIDVEEAAINEELPEKFRDRVEKGKIRKYYACVLVELFFRGIPQRIQQKEGGHYTFGGRVEMDFKSYVLNEGEINMLKQRIEDKDVKESLKLVKGVTEDSLGQIKEDIDHFLEGNHEEEEGDNEKGVNPFSALLGLHNKKPKKKDKGDDEDVKKIEDVKKDSYEEKIVREYAKVDAKDSCFSVYDKYKKAHGMMTPPPAEFWNTDHPR